MLSPLGRCAYCSPRRLPIIGSWRWPRWDGRRRIRRPMRIGTRWGVWGNVWGIFNCRFPHPKNPVSITRIAVNPVVPIFYFFIRIESRWHNALSITNRTLMRLHHLLPFALRLYISHLQPGNLNGFRSPLGNLSSRGIQSAAVFARQPLLTLSSPTFAQYFSIDSPMS